MTWKYSLHLTYNHPYSLNSLKDAKFLNSELVNFLQHKWKSIELIINAMHENNITVNKEFLESMMIKLPMIINKLDKNLLMILDLVLGKSR